MFNRPIKKFLQYYTESTSVGRNTLDGTYPETDDGIVCLPSDTNKEVKLYLRNPQNYPDLVLEYFFSDPSVQAMADSISGAVTIKKMDSNSAFSTVFSKEFLESIDGSDNNSLKGKIKIHQESTLRTFEDFELNLIANTAPLPIRNPIYQLTENGTGSYVVCMFIPVFSGTIHRDIDRLIINGETFYMSEDRTVFYINSEKTITSDKFATSATVYPLSEDGYKFSDYTTPNGYRPIYYFTNQPMSKDTITYELILKDKTGLSVKTSISNKAELLNEVIIKDSNGNILTNNTTLQAADKTGTATIKFEHDGKTKSGSDVTDISVNYSILNGTTVINSGLKTLPCTIEVPYGRDYTITATAQKSFYLDSEETSASGINIKHSSSYYAANYGNDSALGSLTRPFNTIQQCIDIMKSEISNYGLDNNGYTINVLTDIERSPSNSEESLINIDCNQNFTLTIRGIDTDNNPCNRIIDAKGSEEDSHNVITYTQEKLFNLTLENLTITGGNGNSTSNGGINFISNGDGALTLKNTTVTKNTGIEVGGIYCKGILNLTSSDVKIINNAGILFGGIYVNGTIKISGATIKDNTNSYGPSNLCLGSGQIIDITGSLESSEIHVNSADNPTAGNPTVITHGYSDFNAGVDPTDYFIADSFGITYSNDKKEVALAISSGTYDPYINNLITFNFDRSIAPKQGKNTTIPINAILNDGTEKNITNEITSWTLQILEQGDEVSAEGFTASENSITVTSKLPAGTYTIDIIAEYNNRKYGGYLDITVTR